MTSSLDSLLFLFLSIVLGSFCRYFLRKIPLLPYTVALMIMGYIIGVFDTQFNLSTFSDAIERYRTIDPDLLLAIFLPPLLFESAFNVNYHIMMREFWQACILASLGVIIQATIIMLIIKLIFNYNLSWIICLMFGSLLSATDPVAVVTLLRELGAPKRLAHLIEAEALFNDGTAFVLFVLLRDYATDNNNRNTGHAILYFVQSVFGALFFGFISAKILVFWLRRTYKDLYLEVTLPLLFSYLVFWVSEVSFQVSPVIAVVTLGLNLSKAKSVISASIRIAVERFLSILAYLCNTVLFFLSGVIVAYKTLDESIEAIDFFYLGLLYIGVHIARFISVLILYPILIRLGYGLTKSGVIMISFAGLRGAVGLALALVVELDTKFDEDTRSRIVFQISGIVFLTLIINGSLTSRIIHLLHLDKPPSPVTYLRVVERLENMQVHLIPSLKQDPDFSGADWDKINRFIPDYDKLIRKVQRVNESTIEESDHPKSQLKSELQHRILTAMRAGYWRQYDEGLTSEKVVTVLSEAAETALDEDDLSIQWIYLQRYFYVPMLMKFCHKFPFLQKFSNIWLYHRLKFGMELAYVLNSLLKHEHFLTMFLKEDQEQWEDDILKDMKNQLLDFGSKVTNSALDLQRAYPEVYQAMQTRHALKYIYSWTYKEIEEMKKQGCIEEREAERLSLSVDVQLLEMDHRSLLFGLPSNRHVLFDRPFFSHLSKEEQKICLQNAKKKLFQHGDIITSISTRPTGVYIITRGVVKMSVEKDSFTIAGSVGVVLGVRIDSARDLFLFLKYLGLYFESILSGVRIDSARDLFLFLKYLGAWSILTGGRSNHSEAISLVEAYFIPEEIIKCRLDKDITLEQELWKVAGAECITLYLMRFFPHYTFLRVRRLCASSIYHKVGENEEHIQMTQEGALLLTGSFNFKGETHLSPAFIPGPHAQGILQPYSRILYFRPKDISLSQFSDPNLPQLPTKGGSVFRSRLLDNIREDIWASQESMTNIKALNNDDTLEVTEKEIGKSNDYVINISTEEAKDLIE